MIICVDCFHDKEIKGVIKGLSNASKCDVCGSDNTYTYDTKTNNPDLTNMFEDLIDIYTPARYLPEGFPTRLLCEDMIDRWNIFKHDTRNTYLILKHLLTEKYDEIPELFEEPVGILKSREHEYLDRFCITRTHDWDTFSYNIKNINRFHTNMINTSILDIFLDYVKKPYTKGQKLYRGRICSSSNGFDKLQMGPPPKGSATAGRINPIGISCLYLADSARTVIHEVRAGALDYVAIGEFVLKSDIEVVDLAGINSISPFLDIDKTQHAINKVHLKKISSEIAKPVRPADSLNEYLPTQYISDYIKKRFHGY